MGGGEARRLTVRLVNRPTDTPALARQALGTQPPAPDNDRVFDYLPDPVERTSPRPEQRTTEPNVTYGFIGVVGGMIIGALLAYLFGILD